MNKILIIAIALLLIGCNDDKKELIATYKNLETIIESGDAKAIYEQLDQSSKKYVDFMIDEKNFDFNIMKEFGKSVGYPIFTLEFNKNTSNGLKEAENKLDAFMLYLKFHEIPMFSIMQENTLVEEKTETGDENFVTVAQHVGENKYVTSKVKFVKEDDSYKFNLIGLFKFRENVLRQQYSHYQRTYGLEKVEGITKAYESKGDVALPDDMLKSFIENMEKPEHQIDNVRYKIGVK